MFKKISIMASTVLLTFSLIGCGSYETDVQGMADEMTAMKEDVVSFNSKFHAFNNKLATQAHNIKMERFGNSDINSKETQKEITEFMNTYMDSVKVIQGAVSKFKKAPNFSEKVKKEIAKNKESGQPITEGGYEKFRKKYEGAHEEYKKYLQAKSDLESLGFDLQNI